MPWGPGHEPLLAVSNEVTGTVALFTTTESDGPTTLTLTHNNDGESSLLPAARSGLLVGGAAAYRGVLDREIADARAAGHSVANVYAGDAFLAGAIIQCSFEDPEGRLFDAVAQRQMRYDAHILGNHEFDYTPDFLGQFVRAFSTGGPPSQPFLSANLDFTGEPSFADLLDADGLIVGQVTDGRVVARSSILIDPVTTARIGIVGAITPELPTISSPRDVVTLSVDLPSTAALVQDEVDRLSDLGIEKIVVVSHLQSVANDRELVQLLSGVDVTLPDGTITVPGERVRQVALGDGTTIVADGSVVPGAPDLRIVTNNFTAAGGDNHPQLAANPDETVLRKANGQAVAYEEAAREYLQGNPEFPFDGTLRTVLATDVRYAPYPTGTEVRIEIR